MIPITDEIRSFLLKEIKESLNQSFNYKVIESLDVNEEMLNEFSENGWELVNIVDSGNKHKMIFKSPKTF